MLPFFMSSSVTADPAYTPDMWRSLQRLRDRYQESHDQWTERELAQLHFLRWLAQTGRLVEDGGPAAADNGASGQ